MILEIEPHLIAPLTLSLSMQLDIQFGLQKVKCQPEYTRVLYFCTLEPLVNFQTKVKCLEKSS